MRERGKFIVVEGIDLVGKSTQHTLLVQRLRRRGRVVAAYSFPDYTSPAGVVLGEYLRGRVELTSWCPDVSPLELLRGDRPVASRSEHDSLAYQCLQLADKYAAAPEISTHLREGRDVACCRWWQSAYAYGLETGVDEYWVWRTCGSLPRADVNILLDIDPSRVRPRPGVALDRAEADREAQVRVRQRYLRMWSRDTGEHGLWATVDAEGSAELVHGRVLAVLATAGVDLGSEE